MCGLQASGQAEKQSVSPDSSEVKGEGLSLSDSCVKVSDRFGLLVTNVGIHGRVLKP